MELVVVEVGLCHPVFIWQPWSIESVANRPRARGEWGRGVR